MTFLVVAALVGLVVMALAAVNGSFGGGGKVLIDHHARAAELAVHGGERHDDQADEGGDDQEGHQDGVAAAGAAGVAPAHLVGLAQVAAVVVAVAVGGHGGSPVRCSPAATAGGRLGSGAELRRAACVSAARGHPIGEPFVCTSL
jgi:hypothetical protein